MTERFEVRLTPNAEKDLARFRRYQDHVIRELLVLEEDPFTGHPLKGSMRRARALEFSLPGGAYRAAYVILTEERVCLVFMIGPHEGFYREAERRLSKLRTP